MKNRTLPSTQLGDRILDESLDFQSPELQSALQLWNSKRKAATLHALGDFLYEDLAPFMGNIALINVENQPFRYQFLLIGTNIRSIVNEISRTSIWMKSAVTRH